jgi:hypothetical protein
MPLAKRVACMGAMRMLIDQSGKDHFGKKGVDWKIILKRILKSVVGWCDRDSAGSWLQPMADAYEHSIKSSGPTKYGQYVEQLSDNHSAPRSFIEK